MDVARGAIGLSAVALRDGAGALRRRYRDARLPDWFEMDPPQPHRRRLWVIAAVAGATLLAGAVAVIALRRTQRAEEPSLRPPSVDAPDR